MRDELIEESNGVVFESQRFDHSFGLPVLQLGESLADGFAVDAAQDDFLTHVVDCVAHRARRDNGLGVDMAVYGYTHTRVSTDGQLGHTGAVAFSRTGYPSTGDCSDATVLRRLGDVPDDLSAL